jgi:carotenoid cleavage dioxygenase-like enzyme
MTIELEEGQGADINLMNPYLNGIHRPVDRETTVLECKVIGEIPRDLYGVYVRNGPNPPLPPKGMHHWFDGDGMLHAVYFENGKVEYRNRYIKTADFKAERAGCAPGPGVFKRADLSRGDVVYKDTANTDVLMHAGSLLSLWYISGKGVRVDPRTLETIGEENFRGRLPRNISAHAKLDPINGELAFFDYSLYEPWMSFGIVSKENVLTNFQKIPLPGPRLPHDMGLTEHYVVLHDLPIVFTEQGRKNNMWHIQQKAQPARFGIVPRHGTAEQIRWFETEPCYIYHVTNAWEEGDEIVMSACKLLPNGLSPNPQYGPYAPMVVVLAMNAVPVEWRMNMRTGAVKYRQLDDVNGEFPVVNLDAATRMTRWSYNVAMAGGEVQKYDGLYKYDLQSGARQKHSFARGVYGSEAAFAPRVGAKDEDDGYVTVFVTDEETGHSEVLVIDAKNFEKPPIARVQLAVRVPSGFHATWARGDWMAPGRAA